MSLCLIKIVFSGYAPFLERLGLRKRSFEWIGSFTSIYCVSATVACLTLFQMMLPAGTFAKVKADMDPIFVKFLWYF